MKKLLLSIVLAVSATQAFSAFVLNGSVFNVRNITTNGLIATQSTLNSKTVTVENGDLDCKNTKIAGDVIVRLDKPQLISLVDTLIKKRLIIYHNASFTPVVHLGGSTIINGSIEFYTNPEKPGIIERSPKSLIKAGTVNAKFMPIEEKK